MFNFLIKLLIFLFITTSSFAKDFNLQKIVDLNNPWSLAFISETEVLISDKEGEILLVNLKDKSKKKINHNLNYKVDGQGGLLEILKHQDDIFICFTEDRGNGDTSTSIAKAKFSKEKLNFKKIFNANPPINSGYHFGCRMVIQDNKYLYASAGERGEGNIAQDPTKHPGSIIRILLDGSIPQDNPKFKGKQNWLPEIYQIGIRNPQGMTLSPFNNKVYISNHGARGGDFFGEVKFGENYGWKIWCWGGTNYSLSKCGDVQKWDKRFTKTLYTWVPSIAVSAVQIYKGEEFKEWNGDILMTSLKDQSLRKLKFINDNQVADEQIVFKNQIGRLRDIKIGPKGKIYLLSNNNSALWEMSKK
jgi:glucose/arabinose dehydrogenase